MYGLAGEELAAFGDEVDILVVGSRSYGPRAATGARQHLRLPGAPRALLAARAAPRGAATPRSTRRAPAEPLPRPAADTFMGVRDDRRATTAGERRRRGGAVHASPIRIVLADDHAVVRSGLRMLLDSESDFEVVAEASDVDSARRYVRGHHPHGARARPEHAGRLEPRGDPAILRRSRPRRRSSC